VAGPGGARSRTSHLACEWTARAGRSGNPAVFPSALAEYMLGKDLAFPSGPYDVPLAYATLPNIIFHSRTALGSVCYPIPASSR
jgi:hypothetical protein